VNCPGPRTKRGQRPATGVARSAGLFLPPVASAAVIEPMTTEAVVVTFDVYAAELRAAIREAPLLAPFFGAPSQGVDLTVAYCAYLKVTEGYIRCTVPALRAAGRALAGGDDVDRRWSEILLGVAVEETDTEAGTGHEQWATDDMRAVGGPPALVAASTPLAVDRYRRFMVDDALAHPYGVFGAKGVFEHLAIAVAAEFAAGLLASGIPNIAQGVRFISTHGVLDVQHVRHGDGLIRTITDSSKLMQIVEGAIVSREAYYGFLAAMGELYAHFAPGNASSAPEVA
jgi:hypothetical protein